MNEIILVIGILSVLCQFASVYFSYKIYSYNRLGKWWLALVVAFFIQGLRRIFTVFEDSSVIFFTNIQILDRWFMFTISVLIVVGLWSMLKNFESFDVVEKKVRSKLRK